MNTIIKERSNVLNVEVSRRDNVNGNNKIRNNKELELHRGDIILVDMEGAGIGSEQCGKIRPCLVIQNNTGNHFSPTTIVAVGTSKINKRRMKTQMIAEKANNPLLLKDTLILFEQIRVVDKSRIKGKVCTLSEKDMEIVNECIKFSLGLV